MTRTDREAPSGRSTEPTPTGLSKGRLRRQKVQRRLWDTPDMPIKFGYRGVTEEHTELVEYALIDNGFYKGLTAASTILDVAPGTKSYIDRDRLPEGSRMYGIDLSVNMLQTLRKENPQYDGYIVGDAAQLPIADNKVDRVLSTFMMRYLTLYGQIDAILEMVRTTKHGGEIHLVDYDKIFHPGEVRAFSPQMLEDYLSRPHIEKRFAELGKSVAIQTHSLPMSHKMPFPQRLDYMILVVN
jgi:ubiquinone/menaquinone biosynthesis C-methylase UbiE